MLSLEVRDEEQLPREVLTAERDSMGSACGNNRRERLGFQEGVVQAIGKDQASVTVLCTQGGFLVTRPLDPVQCQSLSLGDQVHCYIDDQTIALSRSPSRTEHTGKVTRASSGYYIFQETPDLFYLLPGYSLLTSFEVSSKPIDCLLTYTAPQGFSLRVAKYNPFAHFTLDEAGDKRLIARFRTGFNDSDGVNQAQLRRLSERYSAFRRVTKDGNAVYRCIIVLYLEHLCRKTTSLAEFEAFTAKVDSKESYFAMLPDYQSYADRVSSVLHKLQSLKAAGRCEELPSLQWILQDTSVDLALINYLRLLVANFTAMHYRSSRLKRFINIEIKELVRNLLAYGHEADCIVKYIVPDLLGVVVIQQDVSVDCDEVFETYYTPTKAGKYPELHFCRSASSSYHLLYTLPQQQVDGYDCTAHTYDLSPTSEVLEKVKELLFHEINASDLNAIQT